MGMAKVEIRFVIGEEIAALLLCEVAGFGSVDFGEGVAANLWIHVRLSKDIDGKSSRRVGGGVMISETRFWKGDLTVMVPPFRFWLSVFWPSLPASFRSRGSMST
jgi:hypothetical protein